ncbi:MAG: 6-bladed beta-propeller [Bacteroidota bacterium]|jgi:hypothetical protein
MALMELTTTVKKLLVMSCLVIAAPYAFAQKIIKTDTSHFVTLHVDPSNAMGGNVSDVFSEVNYIPLETTPESTFGSIKQLAVTDKYYIIRDDNTNSVLFFTKDGKYHAKIKDSSTDPYRNKIREFFVNRFTNQIVLSEDSYRTVKYYDFDGKLIKIEDRVSADFKADMSATSFYFIGPNKLVNCDMYRDEDEKSEYYKPFHRSLLQFMDGPKVYATGFNYTADRGKKETISHSIGPLSYFGNDTTLFYSEYFSYSINTVTPNSIKRAYHFVFPLSMSLPLDFATNPIYDEGEEEYRKAHQEQIYCLNNFYKTGDNLLFAATVYDYKVKENQLVYNLKSGTLIALQHVLPDEKSFMLPIFGYSFDFYGLDACDGTYCYNSVSSVEMLKAMQDNKGKNIKYNQTLSDYFAKATKNNNPVIVQLKVKDAL